MVESMALPFLWQPFVMIETKQSKGHQQSFVAVCDPADDAGEGAIFDDAEQISLAMNMMADRRV
jgi:hypothetical protein